MWSWRSAGGSFGSASFGRVIRPFSETSSVWPGSGMSTYSRLSGLNAASLAEETAPIPVNSAARSRSRSANALTSAMTSSPRSSTKT